MMPEIYVKVKPDTEFEIEMKDFPLIGLESEASQGRANSELLRKFEEITGEKPAIISGHKSRRKKLKIQQDKKEFKRKLVEYDG
jgi:uncharacterized protein (TIGR00251 family)